MLASVRSATSFVASRVWLPTTAPVTASGSPSPTSSDAVYSRVKVPLPRLPVFRPVMPSTPSSSLVLRIGPVAGSVSEGVAASSAIVGSAAASAPKRSRSAVVLTFPGSRPVGSTILVEVSPFASSQARAAPRNADCEP